MGYAVVSAVRDGQDSLNDKQDCPKVSIEYVLNSNFIAATKNNDDSWLYIKTNDSECGTYKVSVWYKEPNSYDEVIIMPNCTLILYKYWPFASMAPQMELVQEYELDWESSRYTFEGKSDYYRATTLINLKYNSTYYIKFQTSGFPVATFNHKIQGYQDAIGMYQAALWIRETPGEYYSKYTKSLESKGAIDSVFFLDRTLVADFVSKSAIILANINDIKQRSILPISVKDVIVTVVAAMLTEAGQVGFAGGIGISLLVTGLSNANNVIDNPDGSLLGQITKLFIANSESIEEPKSGSTVTVSNVGLKITLRLKYLMVTGSPKKEDTDSVEFWEDGSLGKDIIKNVEGPIFYKGLFYIDSQLFTTGDNENAPTVATNVMAKIFGWEKYIEPAKEKKKKEDGND